MSVYDRPESLKACLACLSLQEPRGSIEVAMNSTDESMKDRILLASCRDFEASVCWTGDAGAKSCYESANMIVAGKFETFVDDWLCFPSDDSLYVQDFSKIMLDTAAKHDAELVYCDCVYRVGSEDNPHWRPYSVLDVQPKMGRIDKTCFILKRDRFKGFPPHPRNWCDGALIESLMDEGIRHAKAPGVLVVHQ